MTQYLLTARLFLQSILVLGPQLTTATKDAAETIRYIDYASKKGYSMLQLFKYGLTSTSQFLTTECKHGIKLKKNL